MDDQDKRTEEEKRLDDYAARIGLQPDDVLYIRLLLNRAYRAGLTASLDSMSDQQRAELFAGYGRFCRHCGRDDPKCQCWNDE